MGGGKTSLTTELTSRLLNATAVYFDEFEDSTEDPADWKQWFEDGADYNAWKAPGLIAHLEALRSGEVANAAGKPFDYVIFDAPLGRANQATGRFIDHMVHLDTPLDIAMARRILRDGISEETENHLRAYLDWARELFLDDTVLQSADLVLDGALPTDDLADRIVSEFGLITRG